MLLRKGGTDGPAALEGMELSYVKVEMWLVGFMYIWDDGLKEAERTRTRLQMSRPRAQVLMLPHIVLKHKPPQDHCSVTPELDFIPVDQDTKICILGSSL